MWSFILESSNAEKMLAIIFYTGPLHTDRFFNFGYSNTLETREVFSISL